MKRFYTIILLCFFATIGISQGIEGTVYSTNNDSIPFTTIYVPELSKGTTSNIEGRFRLDLPQGKHKCLVQYLGYKSREIEIEVDGSFKKMDITLEPQRYQIPEVRILANGEDPAYRIMKKAIAMSNYFLNQVEEYNCRVYLKGSGAATKIPRLLRKTLKKEGVEEGKYFVVENITDIHFELPNKIDETVVSIRSAGFDYDMSPNNFMSVSLYHDIDGIISPLSQDAFTYYKYELEGSFYDRDYLVNKIKVIPRRKGYDLYSGHIYIVEGYWHLHSVDLRVSQKMFDIEARQVYAPIQEGVWMAISHDFLIDFHALGLEGNYNYVASVSDYKIKLNESIDHSVYQVQADAEAKRVKEEKEIMAEVEKESERQRQIQALIKKDDLTKKESRKLKKMIKKEVKESQPKESLEIVDDKFEYADSAKERTVSYWNEMRPIPLASYELESFRVQDSIQLKVEKKPELKDSIERSKWKLSFGDIMTGGYLAYPEGHSLSFSGIFAGENIDYNTVAGLYVQERFRYAYRPDSSGKYFSITNHVGYSIARDRFFADGFLSYRYNGMRRAWIYLWGGRVMEDFNNTTGISKPLNIITTLFFKDNHKKLFEKDFIKIRHDIDIANGLKLEAHFEYADRMQLHNNEDFYLTNLFNSDFTSNIPAEGTTNPALVKSHQASILKAQLQYTPRQRYRIRNNSKYMSRSKFPTFRLTYEKGINDLFGSDVDYDKLEMAVYQYFNVRKLGHFSYFVRGGSFLNSKEMYFQDFKHFRTNPTYLTGSNEWTSFRLPDYYSMSTNDTYLEGHLRFRNDRILLKRLPFLNETLMNESIHVHYLASTGRKPYYEVGYSLNQIFLMFNLEFFMGFEGSKHQYTGIKIAMPFLDGTNSISIGAY